MQSLKLETGPVTFAGAVCVDHIDGLSIMGEADVRYMPDELHPDAEGYQVMAERMSEALFAPGRPLA